MRVTLQVKRFNPEAEDPKPHYQDYALEVEEHFTVLDALIKVREEMDESLALRCSCRASICGSCAMRVNGHARLACNTKLLSVMGPEGTLRVEPAGNLPVIKDLVVDMEPFWDKIQAVQPWLQPQGPEPEAEYIASNADMQHLTGVMGCIMCGACVSDCTVLEVDSSFLGPAALAKAYRFVADPRDDADQARLTLYNQAGGVWDCTRCFECVQVCPKGVDPMGRIMALRDRAMEAGVPKTYGSRHAEAFIQLVGRNGRLDELQLPLRTFGLLNIPKLLGLLPVGIRAGYKRKVPPILAHRIPGIKEFRRLFQRAKERGQGPGADPGQNG
jgi:succinate dehydrogenase / fumarate reductase iron-sulfur subunit